MEDYPRSSPASSSSAKAATVKVSLDEYVVVARGANTELMTDGLSGCVAVALRSGDRIGLTHVYSDALDRFEDYKGPLTDFARRVANDGEIIDAYLVHNDNKPRKDSSVDPPRLLPTLQDMISRHLSEQGVRPAAIRMVNDNGCAVSDLGLFQKAGDNPAIYAPGGHTNSKLAGLDGSLAERIAPASGALLVRETPPFGYLGASDLHSLDIAPKGNVSEARVEPPKPKVDASVLPLDKSVRAQLVESGKFVATLSPVARGVTEALQEQHFTGAVKLTVSEGGKQIVAVENGKTQGFDVSGRTVTAQSATPMPTPSTTIADTRPKTLYEQATEALSPHRESLKLGDPERFSEAARTIASRANSDGLTDIARVEVLGTEQGKSTLVVHQSGAEPKQSQPTAVEGAPQQGATTPRDPSQDGPQKGHFPIM